VQHRVLIIVRHATDIIIDYDFTELQQHYDIDLFIGLSIN